MREKAGLVLLFTLITHFLFAQNIDLNIDFKYLQTEDGLASNQTKECFQDSKGFIWVTSNGGLNRYDGNSCKKYRVDPNDTTKLQTPLTKAITEDKNGDIWIGTIDKGIVRFDQNLATFTHYTKKSKVNATLDNSIVTLMTDHNGDVWFGGRTTGIGKITIEKGKQKSIRIQNYNELFPKNNQSSYILEDSENRIWFATSAGLYTFENNGKVPIIKHVFSKTPIAYITHNKEGELVFTDNTGQIYWVPSKDNPSLEYHTIKRTEEYEKTCYNEIIYFKFINNTKIIAARIFHGMCTAEIDFQKKEISLVKNFKKNILDPTTPQTDGYRHLLIDKQEIVWIATLDAGVMYFDLNKKQFAHIHQGPQENGLKGNNVYQVLEDKYGHLWFSVKSADIHFIHKDSLEKTGYNKFSYLGKKHGVNNPMLTTIYETHTADTSSLWFSSWITYQIKRYDPLVDLKYFYFHPYVHHPKESKFPRGMFFSMSQVKSGKIYYGSYANGLITFDLDSLQDIQNIQILKHNPEDSLSISDNTIRAIHQTKDGAIWVGTSNGLNRVTSTDSINTPLAFKKYTNDPKNPKSIGHNYILNIYEDTKGRMWLGTLGGGLIKVVRDQEGVITEFRSYTTENGLANDVIKGILEDDHGNLWLSTSGGLSRFSTETEKVKNYTKEDGLQDSDFQDNSCIKRANGHMLFGGFKGFNVFHPDSIKDNEHIPQIVITDFKVFGKSVDAKERVNGHLILPKSIVETDTITVTYDENVIELHFAALHFASPKKNQLKYMLKGFDKDWIIAEPGRRFATYSNLKGGTYTFKVMGSNNDGVWNPTPKIVTIIVLPPWWDTLWFKILLALSIIVLSVSYYLYRMRAIKAENERLEQLVENRTQKLKLANVELEENQEEILAQNDEIKEQANKLRKVNTEVSQHAEELESLNENLEIQKTHIERSYENIKHLGEFGQEITAILDIKDIRNTLTNYIESFMKADSYGLALLSGRKTELVYTDFVRFGKLQNTFICKLSQNNSLAALCVESKKDVITGHLSRDYADRISHTPEIELNIIPDSVVYIPLFDKGSVVGILIVHHKSRNFYTDQEIGILKSLSSYLSIAITNSRSYQIINRKNEDINSSMRYAQTIQQAILPLPHQIEKYVNFFSIFRPKDVVSGDFYWFTAIKRNNQPDLCLIAVIDCTGHGVPGAIMSIVSNGALNRIVNERKVHEPSAILETLDTEIQNVLKQDETDNNDGMDVCLCSFTEQADGSQKIQFSASKRPLYLFRSQHNELEIHKGTRRYIGGRKNNTPDPFTTLTFELEKGDTMYLSSDGYVDQHKADRSKFGSNKLHSILKSIGQLPPVKQKQALEEAFDQHKQDEPQRDDVTLIGVTIK